jgi:hypothetical protein
MGGLDVLSTLKLAFPAAVAQVYVYGCGRTTRVPPTGGQLGAGYFPGERRFGYFPALQGHWDSPLAYVKFGSEFILLLLPLWFIFRGRNWARWLQVSFAFGGFCVSLPQLIRHFEAHSVSWIATYCWRNMIVVGALIALFLPMSSRWFGRSKNANVV